MKPLTFRQGDVLIERIDSIPSTAKKLRKTRRVILALGEATGHHHRIENGRVTAYAEPDTAEVSFLEIQQAVALLEHEEHDAIKLPPGKYRVHRQREYTPQAIRRVQD